jgi:acyl-CoA-binding protein
MHLTLRLCPPSAPSLLSPFLLQKKNEPLAGLELDNRVSFAQFRSSVDAFSKSGARCSTAQRLTLYGLYKQSMFGDIDYPRPKGDPKLQRKYDAWNVFKGLGQSQCMSAYVGIVNKLLKAQTCTGFGSNNATSKVCLFLMEEGTRRGLGLGLGL